MKIKFMSLASLFKSQKEDEDDTDTEAADKKKMPGKDKEKKDDGESGDGEGDQTDEEKKKKEDKKKNSETTDETKADEESVDGKSASVNSVHLALDDFNQLYALASTAKSLGAENTKLKAKADEWDNYQAALSGGKADNDTAGAGGKNADKSGKTAIELLREKHGSLVD